MKTLYRHVDILRAAGFDAVAVHARRGFAAPWFAHETAVTSIPDVSLGPQDIVVVPEIFGRVFLPREGRGRVGALRALTRRPEMPWKVCRQFVNSASRIVIINLNPFNTFKFCDIQKLNSNLPYRHPAVIAALTISRYCQDFLAYAFPDLPVVNYTKAVDPTRFRPRKGKLDRICFMPRKRRDDVVRVLSLLRSRGALEGFELLPIEGMSESEVADAMAGSRLFLSFSHDEGLPRPPMEAMLSECVVIGYHGQGGREYMRPDICYPIEDGDVVGFAQTIDQVLSKLRVDPEAIAELVRAAREFVLTEYSPEKEARDVVQFWSRIAEGSDLRGAAGTQ